MAGLLHGNQWGRVPLTRPRLGPDDLSPEPALQLSSISESGGPLAPLSCAVPSLNAARSLPRCTEKGCVFPASRRDTGKCRQHELQDQEPSIFNSQQPSMMMLDQAKFGPPDADYEQREWRARDRRRRARLWQAFHEGTG